MAAQHHPYYPTDTIVEGFAPNESPLFIILAGFGGVIALFVGSCVGLARWRNSRLGRWELGVVGWYALCGFLHCFFEGYFVFTHATLPSSQSFFAQLWKEYSLSDSRYIASDPFMLCIEGLTMITWGPLSLYGAYLTALPASKGKQGLRHVIQIVVAIGHLYGVALYYGTCHFIETQSEGRISYSRPEFMYYWVYYAGMNAPWAVVPWLLLWQSAKEIEKAFRVAARIESKKGR
ncbi:Emopamil-binding protein [Podospora australis]|uniref:Emopamil-binding protein n=1 Tax=Podospora australis TaxID=1536484 RepID=A0AAN7ALR6_9PEZI|nr:Emopamil-binding protein [Podospora australis]